MKVLHTIPSLSPQLGGPPLVAMNLVKALRDLGIAAEIATTNYGLEVPLLRPVDYSFAPAKTIPVRFFPYTPPPLKEFIFSKAITTWCWENLAHYDVLDNHYLFSYVPSCAGAIARRQNIPYTVRTMGQLTTWALAQSATKKRLYSTLIERRNLARAAAIHCTTPAEVEDVRNFGLQTPTITLPLGVDPPIALPEARQQVRHLYGIASSVPIVLFLSRIHYKKRPDFLLQCLGQIKQLGHPFHLIFAGSGEEAYLEQLRSLAATLGLTDHVTFAGFVTGKDKDLLLQGSDIFALPSHSENFGIAVAEALAAKLPVIITPGVQIAPDIEQAAAGFVVPGQQSAIVEALTQLLQAPQLRHEMGRRGADLAATRYSWHAIAQKLIPAYELVAARKALPRNWELIQP